MSEEVDHFDESLSERVERFNEWWTNGDIREELVPKFRRFSFERILESFNERQILMIVGPRRVGKTTLMYQAIDYLLSHETPPKRILYYSFEKSLDRPEEVLNFYEKKVLRKSFSETGKIYVFLDEIQHVVEWASEIKRFYDLYPNIKFVVSGSSSLLLSKEARDRLAGRFFLMYIKPLGFREFLEMKGIKIMSEDLDMGTFLRLIPYFYEYLKRSGFPEIVNWENETRIVEYIKNSVIDRVILRDIPVAFKVRDVSLMETLLDMVLSSPGCVINVNSLSRDLGKSKITISNYLKYLEVSLL
ncbi:MAG: ATP-binding protein, partial [Candidatus Korarchaeota archaeon]